MFAGGLVANSTGDFTTNHVANSDPTLANFGGSTEIGGHDLNLANRSDVYLGGMQDRSVGNLVTILNRYCGGTCGTEGAQWSLAWDGESTQNSHINVGANKTDGRISSVTGSLLAIAAGGPVEVWNKGAQDVAQFATGVGATQVASVGVTGIITGQMLGVTAAGTGTAHVLFSGTTPTITGFAGTGAAVSASNGSTVLDINVGTVAPGNTGTITFPAATTGWVCNCYNKTTTTAVNKIIVTSDTTTTCVIAQVVASTNAAANFAASDHVRCMCGGL